MSAAATNYKTVFDCLKADKAYRRTLQGLYGKCIRQSLSSVKFLARFCCEQTEILEVKHLVDEEEYKRNTLEIRCFFEHGIDFFIDANKSGENLTD